MKLKEIYKLEPIYSNNDLGAAFSALKAYANSGDSTLHLEIRYFFEDSDSVSEIKDLFDSSKIECKHYMDESDANDKWGASLYSVFYNKEPLMLVKNSGRYFTDYETYISNEKGLKDLMTELVLCKKQIVNEESNGIYSEDEYIPNLDIVASYALSQYYDKDLTLNYKEGDIVWAWVKENHLNHEDNYVLTRVSIRSAFPHKKNEAYYGNQLDRKWAERGISNLNVMQFEQDKGIMGCSLEENRIVGLVNAMDMPSLAINNLIDENGFLPSDYKVKQKECIEKVSEKQISPQKKMKF